MIVTEETLKASLPLSSFKKLHELGAIADKDAQKPLIALLEKCFPCDLLQSRHRVSDREYQRNIQMLKSWRGQLVKFSLEKRIDNLVSTFLKYFRTFQETFPHYHIQNDSFKTDAGIPYYYFSIVPLQSETADVAIGSRRSDATGAAIGSSKRMKQYADDVDKAFTDVENLLTGVSTDVVTVSFKDIGLVHPLTTNPLKEDIDRCMTKLFKAPSTLTPNKASHSLKWLLLRPNFTYTLTESLKSIYDPVYANNQGMMTGVKYEHDVSHPQTMLICTAETLRAVDVDHATETSSGKTDFALCLRNQRLLLDKSTIFTRQGFRMRDGTVYEDIMTRCASIAQAGLNLNDPLGYRDVGTTDVFDAGDPEVLIGQVLRSVPEHVEQPDAICSTSLNHGCGAMPNMVSQAPPECTDCNAIWVWIETVASMAVLLGVRWNIFKLNEFFRKNHIWANSPESLWTTKRSSQTPADLCLTAALGQALARGPDKERFIQDVVDVVRVAHEKLNGQDVNAELVLKIINGWTVTLGSENCVVRDTVHKSQHMLITPPRVRHSVHFLPTPVRYLTFLQQLQLSDSFKAFYAKHVFRVFGATNCVVDNANGLLAVHQQRETNERIHQNDWFGATGVMAHIVGGVKAAGNLQNVLSCEFNRVFQNVDKRFSLSPSIQCITQRYHRDLINELIEKPIPQSTSKSRFVDVSYFRKNQPYKSEVVGRMLQLPGNHFGTGWIESMVSRATKMFSESTWMRIVGYHECIVRNDYSDHSNVFHISFSSFDAQTTTTESMEFDLAKEVGVYSFELFIKL